MSENIQPELTKYYADNHSAALIQNVMQFLYNSTIKNSDEADKNETDFSREFGSLLLKYYENRLKGSDILYLKALVDKYNLSAWSEIQELPNKDSDYLLKNIFSLKITSTLNANEIKDLGEKAQFSFYRRLDEYVRDHISSVKLDEEPEQSVQEQFSYITVENVYDFLTPLDKGAVLRAINEGKVEGEVTTASIINQVYVKSGKDNFEVVLKDILTKLSKEDAFKEYFEEKPKEEMPETVEEAPAEPSETPEETTPETPKKSRLELYVERFAIITESLIKEFIQSYIFNYFIFYFYEVSMVNQSNPTSEILIEKGYPDLVEYGYINQRENVEIIDLKFKSSGVSDYFKETVSAAGTISPNDQIKEYRFVVLYKETNPYYREALQSNIFESFFSMQLVEKAYNMKSVLFNGNIPIYVSNIHTFSGTKESLIFPNYVDALNSKEYIFKYFYGGSIQARLLKNNSIISFCYGDSVYSNTFGAQIFAGFDKEAVFDFLDEFQSSRDYFYSVLYNPSFVAEPNYEIFIKLSIITFAINRWVNIYSSTGKDPGKYNLQDMNNFLRSLDLDSIANAKGTLSEYAIKKKIVSNYGRLARDKGTANAIELIIKILQDISNLSYRKYMIGYSQTIQNQIKTNVDGKKTEDGKDVITKLIDPDSIEASGINFFSIGQDQTTTEGGVLSTVDIFKYIKESGNSGNQSYQDFIKDDPYWSEASVPESLLKQLDIPISDSKYIEILASEDRDDIYYKSQLNLSTYFDLVLNDVEYSFFKENAAELAIPNTSIRVNLKGALGYLIKLSRLLLITYYAMCGKVKSEEDLSFLTGYAKATSNIGVNPYGVVALFSSDAFKDEFPEYKNEFSKYNGENITLKQQIELLYGTYSSYVKAQELVDFLLKIYEEVHKRFNDADALDKSHISNDSMNNLLILRRMFEKEIFITQNDINDITMGGTNQNLEIYPYTFFNQSAERVWFVQALSNNGIQTTLLSDKETTSEVISLADTKSYMDSLYKYIKASSGSNTKRIESIITAIYEMISQVLEVGAQLNSDNDEMHSLDIEISSEVEKSNKIKLVSSVISSFTSYTVQIARYAISESWDSSFEKVFHGDALERVRIPSTRSDIVAVDDELTLQVRPNRKDLTE